MPAITVADLVVAYGERTAVDHLSFSIAESEIAVILGRNGAGKSSTIESMEGLRTPASGAISILGHNPAVDQHKLASIVGVMLQSGGPYPTLNPLRALQLEAAYYENPRNVDALIERLDLKDVQRTPAKRLSGGEHRRLCFALALVGNPQVIFLDEPTAGVDPHGRIAIREFIQELRHDGKTIVVTTHELDEAERIADQIFIIDHGRLVTSGTPTELVSRPQELRFKSSAGLDLATLRTLAGKEIVEVTDGTYRVSSAPTPELIALIATYFSQNKLQLLEIGSGNESLEDLFLSVTSDVEGDAK